MSKMYQAIRLVESDRDLHRFVWRSHPDELLRDYPMTHATFSVSASCFAANMTVKHKATDYALDFPKAAAAIDSFYVDDCLSGANSKGEAIDLQQQLVDLFAKGDFLLRKWNCSDPDVIQDIKPEYRDN